MQAFLCTFLHSFMLFLHYLSFRYQNLSKKEFVLNKFGPIYGIQGIQWTSELKIQNKSKKAKMCAKKGINKFALICIHLHSFALFCTFMHSFTLLYTHLHSFTLTALLTLNTLSHSFTLLLHSRVRLSVSRNFAKRVRMECISVTPCDSECVFKEESGICAQYDFTPRKKKC